MKTPILNKEAYTSQDWFNREMRLIFGKAWQFAGFVEDVTEAGDYITVQCGHQNIMVVKNKKGELKAFHNLCRHRGTQLLRAVGKGQKAITCPYHDWVYDLTGQLIHVPEENDFHQLNKKEICLHKAAVAVWRGCIWVNPDPKAMPITAWFAGCEKFLGPHNPERLIEYPDTSETVIINANWKIVAENYMDVYHLSHLHSSTLDMYAHKEAEFGFVREHYLFSEPLSKYYNEDLENLIPYKRIGEVTDEYLGAYVPFFFPNTGFSETESSWSIFNIIPMAPDKTKVVVRSKLEPMTEKEFRVQEKRSNKAWMKRMEKHKGQTTTSTDPLLSGDFMKEDIYACEQQQKGLMNPLFEAKYSAEHLEESIRFFQATIAKWTRIDK